MTSYRFARLVAFVFDGVRLECSKDKNAMMNRKYDAYLSARSREIMPKMDEMESGTLTYKKAQTI
jgi:hypothetical protein